MALEQTTFTKFHFLIVLQKSDCCYIKTDLFSELHIFATLCKLK